MLEWFRSVIGLKDEEPGFAMFLGGQVNFFKPFPLSGLFLFKKCDLSTTKNRSILECILQVSRSKIKYSTVKKRKLVFQLSFWSVSISCCHTCICRLWYGLSYPSFLYTNLDGFESSKNNKKLSWMSGWFLAIWMCRWLIAAIIPKKVKGLTRRLWALICWLPDTKSFNIFLAVHFGADP